MNTIPPFRHILIIEDQKARRIIALEDSTYGVGRESSNDIVIYDRVVSRHHATLLRVKISPKPDSYSYRIIDGDLHGNRSTNGLIINGRATTTHDLKHGDVILFGSDSKASYYILSTSLKIALFNPSDDNELSLLDEEATMISEDSSKSTLITGEEWKQPVIATPEKNSDHSPNQMNQTELVRLASFPELSPNPIIEMNFVGDITYLNPAASIKFKTIHQEKLNHPALSGLLSEFQSTEGNLLLREIKVNDETFEQYVHYLVDSQLVRSYLFDISERKQFEQKLTYHAFHDTLTGLPNRNWFDEQLEIAIAQAKRKETSLAIMFIDLDCFKNINDTLGHSIGDIVLEKFSQRLNNCVRTGDIVARWGGDEFTLILGNIQNAEDSVHLAQRILAGMKPPIEVNEHQLYVKCSIGIAIYPQDGLDRETLVKNADAALYRAKERGRNHYRFYSSTMTSKASLLLKLENLLHDALKNDEFTLNYQPQLHLKHQKITGMEALLRWYHPELGQVSPLKLIPLAEKTDLIFPLGEWVLKTACEQNCAWQKAGFSPVPISVNFSPRQFQHPHLVEMVQQTLEKTGMDPQWLEVEVTENTIMQNAELALEMMQGLKALGVNLSMDDFGTGYSSLSYLQKYPFHTLKIDQSFVQNLQDKPQDEAIISAIIALGRSFHLRVIAEGVETLQQLEILRRLHCEEIQGFWFSRPLPTENATQLLAQRA
ncbi:MAG: EAL domain-containing protein [Microcystaceae cyanobacterium]